MRTLVIDGNFFGQRVLRALPELTFKVEPKLEKLEFLKACCSHLASYLDSQKGIVDNVVIVKDARSWRREVPIIRPNTDKPIADYKANRDERMEEEVVDMTAFFTTLQYFFEQLSDKFNVPYTCVPGAEGDDAIWAWTKALQSTGKYSMVYCTDSDLNQLVSPTCILHRQVKTKEAPIGGEVVCDATYWQEKNSDGDIFSTDCVFWAAENSLIGDRKLGAQIKIANPYWGVFKKMFEGDPKDNIPACHIWFRTIKTTGATQQCRVTSTMVENALNNIFIGNWKTDETFLYDASLHEMILRTVTKMKKLDINLKKSLEVVANNRKLLYLNKKEIDPAVQNKLANNIKPQLNRYAKLKQLQSTAYLYNAFGLSDTTYFQTFGT